MKKITLLCIGKTNDSEILSLENQYKKRLKLFEYNIVELKSHNEDLEKESAEAIKKIEQLLPDKIIVLKEKGHEFSSTQFSKWLHDHLIKTQHLCFIIGGSSGHGEAVLKIAQEDLSLSKLTFPHQFTRVIFAEQLYRAQTIIANHPYHK